MVNRQDYDCSICPVEDPTTWTADDLDFKIICEDGWGELSFQLDNFLEVNWLQSTTIELVYNSEDNGEFRELVTKTAGTQKKDDSKPNPWVSEVQGGKYSTTRNLSILW